MLARELLSRPDGFLLAANGEEEYVVTSLQRVPTHANIDDTVMHWQLNLSCSDGNIKR